MPPAGEQLLLVGHVMVFTSDRERRLWAWALVAVSGIYSTLVLAQTLTSTFTDRRAFENSFMLLLLALGAAVVALGLKLRPGGAEIGVGIGIAAVYLMALTRMGSPSERSHLIEYSIVAALIYAALRERGSQGAGVRFPALLAIAATAVVGLVDELVQLGLPWRVFAPLDIGFTALAAVMAVVATGLLIRVRRRAQREPP